MRPPRFRVNIPVDCSTAHIFLGNRITNISRGGVFIEGGDALPLQSEVELTFVLPNLRTAIEARGRVVWNYDIRKGSTRIITGSGIKFTDISHEHRSLLENYLAGIAQVTEASH